MGDKPKPMMVGTVTARFKNAQAVGMKITGTGFTRGDTLYIESSDGRNDFTFTVDSIQQDHLPIDFTLTGMECAVFIPFSPDDIGRELPPKNSTVFLIVNEDAEGVVGNTTSPGQCDEPLDSQVCDKGPDQE